MRNGKNVLVLHFFMTDDEDAWMMIRSTYVRLVWIANEFTQICLNAHDFGLVKLQMGITDDYDQLSLFSLASFVLYEDKIHIAGVCLVWKCFYSMVSQCWF